MSSSARNRDCPALLHGVAASEARNSRRAVGSVPDRSCIGSLSDRCTVFSRGPGVVGDNAFSVHFSMRMVPDGYWSNEFGF
jgi:hypothetical protein